MIISFLIYTSIFVFSSLFAEYSSKLKNVFARIFLGFVSIIIPAYFAGIRYGIGTDYFPYVGIFNLIKSGRETRHEIGFSLLNRLVALIGGNEHHLFFLMSFITIFFIYINLTKNKKDISVGLGMFVFLLLYYNQSYNIMRQIAAMAIVLYSFNFIFEKKFLKFFLILLLATSMHIIAIVVLPFYYIFNYAGNKNRFIRTMIYILVFIAIYNFETLLNIVSQYFIDFSYYNRYTSDEEARFGIGVFVLNAPFFIPGILYNKRLTTYSKKFSLYFFILTIGFLIRFIGYLGSDYIGRLADLFFISNVMIIPYYFRVLKRSDLEYVIKYGVLLFIIINWIYLYIILGRHGTVPYMTIY